MTTTCPESFTPSLEMQRLLLACEGLSVEVSVSNEDLVQTVVSGVSRIGRALKDAFQFVTTWDFSQPERLEPTRVERALRKVQYTSLDQLKVHKPIGFQGQLHPYATELVTARLQPLIAVNQIILPLFITRFGNYLNNPDDLRQRRIESLPESYSAEVLDELIADEAKWTIDGNRSTEEYYQTLFQNNRECVETMALVNDLNQRRWKEAPPREVAKQVERLNQVALALFNQLKDDSVPVSRQVTQALAQELQLAARWTEWYSVMVTRIIDLTTALKLTESKLLRVL